MNHKEMKRWTDIEKHTKQNLNTVSHQGPKYKQVITKTLTTEPNRQGRQNKSPRTPKQNSDP